MRILIGCEESQVICKTFRDAGHEAYSCDLQPTRGNPDWHYHGDIIKLLAKNPANYWDLIILHPDCTKLANSGNRWYGKGMKYHHEREEAIKWTMNLWYLAIQRGKKVALENPNSVIFPHLRNKGAVVQYVQPWMFGHTENKKTGFALYNLPALEPTNDVSEQMKTMSKAETDRVHRMAPGPNRKRDRSKTFQGVADAIVGQWG